MKKSETELAAQPFAEEIWKGLFEEVCKRIGPLFEREADKRTSKIIFTWIIQPNQAKE
jgi:hypothetical protein